ncbi:MAG: hypothetical protein IKV74_03850 [Clostridia bacterium]|nr:hypothetical protein [Clostridia bacterium]
MNKMEMNDFIEKMGSVGDEWTLEQVEDVYGNMTLEEALVDRKKSLDIFFGILGNAINYDKGVDSNG